MSYKKIIKIIIIILILIAIFFAIGQWYEKTFHGTSLEKEKALEEMNLYLKNKYKKEMILTGVWYDFKNKHYNGVAHPIGQKKIVFDVNKIDWGEYRDTYNIRRFEYELSKELIPFVNNLYSLDIYTNCNINATSGNIYTQISNLSEDTKLEDILGLIKYAYIFNIQIDGDGKFDSSNNQEVLKIYKVIEFVKSKGYSPYEISFRFIKDNNYETSIRIYFNNKEIDEISTIDSLVKILNTKIK